MNGSVSEDGDAAQRSEERSAPRERVRPNLARASLVYVLNEVQVQFGHPCALCLPPQGPRHGRRERMPLPAPPLLSPYRPATVMSGRPHSRGGVLEPTCGSARRECVRWRVWGRMDWLDIRGRRTYVCTYCTCASASVP